MFVSAIAFLQCEYTFKVIGFVYIKVHIKSESDIAPNRFIDNAIECLH